MTALESVAVHVPQVRLRIGSLREQLGISAAEMRVFERFYGLAEVPKDDGDLTDLLWHAVTQLELPPERARRIRYVLHARSVNVITPYPANPLHDITTRLGLEHALAFSVSQHACASGLLAVDLAFVDSPNGGYARSMALQQLLTHCRARHIAIHDARRDAGLLLPVIAAHGDYVVARMHRRARRPGHNDQCAKEILPPDLPPDRTTDDRGMPWVRSGLCPNPFVRTPFAFPVARFRPHHQSAARTARPPCAAPTRCPHESCGCCFG